MNKDEITSILKISKYKRRYFDIMKLLELAESKGGYIYNHGTCLLCFIKVEDFDLNKTEFTHLDYFKNFSYSLNENEYIILLYTSANSIDTKIVGRRFTDENNPLKVHYFNDKTKKINTLTRRYIDFFRDFND